ncbi:hypothetical protein DPMN_048245 [Dreissena polymorpha]|uniref:Uncharacterized protein n=1 Tax=Dreissena polymorpha TaxID=45954 RepID=A0A9D4HZY6_DREPO|nr:hypothetical protein DPMN_048245 [Dreissena polymorpha]
MPRRNGKFVAQKRLKRGVLSYDLLKTWLTDIRPTTDEVQQNHTVLYAIVLDTISNIEEDIKLISETVIIESSAETSVPSGRRIVELAYIVVKLNKCCKWIKLD